MEKSWLDHRRLAEGFTFASSVHRNQMRKDTKIPYISHLMGVCAIVLEYGGDEDQALAGLLHDVIEDGGVEYEPVILKLFGENVRFLVRACTDTDEKPKPPWKERKEAYLERLRREGSYVLLVSAADKLHNARSIVSDQRHIGDDIFKRFNATKEQTLWYYSTLSNIYLERMSGHLADELERTVTCMQELAGV